MPNNNRTGKKNTGLKSTQFGSSAPLWFESFPEALSIIDPEGIILRVNESFALWFGKNPEEFIGNNIYDLVSPEIAGHRKKKVEEVLRTRKPFSWDDERNGRIFHHSIYPVLSPEEGAVDHIMTVSQDVTDFQRSEKNLHASTERLQLIMAETHAGSWEWELNTNINIWSDELWQLFGMEKYSREPSFELWRQSIIPEDRHRTEKAVMNASNKGVEFTVEWRVCGCDGELRWLMSKGVPFKDSVGQVCRYVGIVIDITDRMKVEEKLKQSEERFRKMFEGHSATQFIIDPDTGKIIDANQAAADFYGWDIDTLKKMRIQQINTLSSDEVMGEMNKSRIAEKQQFSFQHRRVDGSVRDVEVFSNSIAIDGKELLYSIVHDVTGRKHAEKLFVESNERYRSLFNNMLNGIAYCRIMYEGNRPVDFIYEEVNSRFEILTGLKRVEGKKVSEVIPGIHERYPELLETYARVAATGASERLEFIVEPLSIALDISVYSQKKGFFVAVFDNITERKQVEDALRKSEERFRKMFESHSAAMIIVDPDTGSFVDANQAAVAFYGWSVDELRQMRVQDITNVTSEAVKENIEKIRSSNQNRFLFRHRRADGSVRDVEVFSKNIEISGKELLYTIVHDITERMRFESLTEFRHRLMEVAESCSAEQILQFALNDIEKMTGSKFGFYQVININQSTLLLQELPTGLKNHVCRTGGKGMRHLLHESAIWAEAVREKQTVFCNEYATSRLHKSLPDNHPEVRREMITPVIQNERVFAIIGVRNKPNDYDKDDARYASAVANIAGDIITRKLSRQSEIKLQEALIQSQKMELVGQLAGGIAHDFNNMLTVILGHTEIALAKADSSYNHLESIQKAANHSAELTRQLLAFARKQTIITKVLDLNVIVDGTLSMLRHLIGENITLTWIPSSQNAQVKFDPSQLDQILANLCINARDAIDGNGNIIIETNSIHIDHAGSAANHPCTIPGDYITLAISDNGKGIDKKHIPHIFEPFFTTKEVGKGTGMGLSTVYGIVKQNNGYIDFQSEKGKGTRFRIYLPRHRRKPATESGRNPELVLSSGTETILLVEDQPEILKLYRQMLEQKGYTVLAAARPSAAIRLAEQYKEFIDLLVTDVIMPEMNGSDLFKRLQSASPDLKVLFMSGYTADFIARHIVFDEGVNFIEKPFHINTLTKIVQEILKSR